MAIKSGWLYKTPPNITKFLRWKKRHFDLFDNGDLAYSQSNAHEAVLGLIHLEGVEEILDAEEMVNCLFTIGLYCPAQKRTMYLRAESRAEIDSWCREMQRFVPAYAHLPPDHRPVYKSLPDEVSNSLPILGGFLYTPEMDLFTKQKFCAISEGQFRIYNNQSQEHLYLIYSLLSCKGVQELTDNTRGRTNSFQFRIEFASQQKKTLVLSARSPFERQGWIVCLMKTITILSQHRNSFTPPSDIDRRRSASAPAESAAKLVLTTQLNGLVCENEQLKRQGAEDTPPDLENPHLLSPSPGQGVSPSMRPNTLPSMFRSIARGRRDSYTSESSEECNFKDCSSALSSRPNSSNPASQAEQLNNSILSNHELVQTQLLTFCQELGCVDVDLHTDLVPVLVECVEQMKLDFNENSEEKDRNIDELKTCKIQQDKNIEALGSQRNHIEEEMHKMSTEHEAQLDAIKEENTKITEDLKTKLESELEALKEENRRITDLNHQTEEKEKDLRQALDQISTERDKTTENNLKLLKEQDSVRSDVNNKISEIANLRATLKDKENEIEYMRDMMPKQPPKKPPLPQ